MGTLTFEPLISPALWAALAVAAAALLAWYGWRRPVEMGRGRWAAIITLMSAALAGVLIILLNPTWIEELPPPEGKPRLTVLVDASASMGTPDVDGRPRYQAAARLANDVEAGLRSEFDVQARVFAATATPAGFDGLEKVRPETLVTDLAAAIVAATDEDRPQGQAVVLLSDGGHNAGGVQPVLEAVRLARAMAAPVYCRTLGGEAAVRDMALDVVMPQEIAFVAQQVAIEARLTHQNMPGARTTVTLLADGQELARKEVTLLPNTPSTVRFDVSRPAKGLTRYELRADAIPGEATVGNNTAVFLLRTVDEPIHILLLEGKPYWDGKFLMRTLAADPLAELDSIVRVADGRLVRQTLTTARPASQPASGPAGAVVAAATQPARSQKWSVVTNPADVLASPESLRPFQIIVLGRDADVFLTDAALGNLRDWVAREGGALLCFRGSPMAQVTGRLASILPVEWTNGREARFRVKLTERGQEMRWLPGGADANAVAGLAELPTLATIAQVGRTKPLANVLATAVFADGKQETPVVTWQPYGTGRAAVIEGAGMWRWAFLPPDQQEHDAVYGTLWHSMLRWLVSGGGLLPGEKLALRGEKVRFSTLEPAGATLLLRESAGLTAPAVELVPDGGGEARKFVPAALKGEPGPYRVTFGKLPVGRYRARLTGDAAAAPAGETVFDVAGPLDEQLDLQARPDLMKRIADESGGAVLEKASPDEIARRFHEHSAVNRPPRVRRISAWDRWWIMFAVFGVWAGAWALRRSGGLV
jgi:hypothetical protein